MHKLFLHKVPFKNIYSAYLEMHCSCRTPIAKELQLQIAERQIAELQ